MASLTSSVVSFVGNMAFHVVKWAAIGHCVLEYGVDAIVCAGPSMEPTIKSKDRVLIERISPSLGHIPRNSIVISKSPLKPKHLICKRVVAVAGDSIILPDGTETLVPKGHVWVEGDNFHNSSDSRSYGPIPIGLIRGRAILRFWPLSEIGALPEIANNQK